MADQRAGGIAWCDRTWNPIRGCSRVSEGCRNCYAEAMAGRWSGPGMAYEGLVRQTNQGPRWTGAVAFIEKHLEDPLRWRKPARIFVNSMSDLFHENLPFPSIARIFTVMAQAPQHRFLVLTKRPARMREFFDWNYSTMSRKDAEEDWLGSWPNVWLGVSVEDQVSADGRIPLLLETPAAIRWVSYEPALRPVDFTRIRSTSELECHFDALDRREALGQYETLDWIVVGGESGPDARAFDVAWARSTVAQCRAAGVPVFVKQLGSYPILDPRYDRSISGATRKLRHPRGEDPEEWPEDLRVREFPTVVAVAA